MRSKIFAFLMGIILSAKCGKADYDVGVGIADITGPAAGVNMMGYAELEQTTKGIHMRLYARSFIFDDGKTRTVFVSADIGMMGQLIKEKVITKLEKEFGDLYRFKNVVLSGTHTHSGPAGYLQYLTFGVSSLGFVKQSFECVVIGIVESIRKAHKDMQPSRIFFTEGRLLNANINRSPTAYETNPANERNQYKDGNTDKTFSQLHIMSNTKKGEDKLKGVINWFAVHPTSLPHSNRLISGDNKGYASYLFEKTINGENVMPGKGDFVAAFASSNHGDISPNLNGPKCVDTGEPCDLYHSTCHGQSQKCFATGPGKDPFESMQIIGERQFKKAYELYNDASSWIEVVGDIRYAHQWINMSHYEVVLKNGTKTYTCDPALGYSFAAGTTDGPGQFDFTQGTNSSNPFWDFISGLLVGVGEEEKKCHSPKPILLNSGKLHKPYLWHPKVVDTQMLKIGPIVIAAIPGEMTTMAGRRMKKAIEEAAKKSGAESRSIKVIVAGLCNLYTHYITTLEEYQQQRYEGASTIYGPYTLRAYLQQYGYLTSAMLNNTKVLSSMRPPDLLDEQISMVPKVLFDNPKYGHDYGDCILQPPAEVRAGDSVRVRFISGHPRNNLLLEDTFLEVRKMEDDNSTSKVVAMDSSWETKFEWQRTNIILMESEVLITWNVPEDAIPGLYFISHKGYYKPVFQGQKVKPYNGMSHTFRVISKDSAPATIGRKVSGNNSPQRKNVGNFFSDILSRIYSFLL